MKDKDLITEQIAYYRARAAEYDEWHQRLGRYDRGEEHRRQWFRELDIVREALAEYAPYGTALELACGTGLWTRYLVDSASSLTAIDAVKETIEINRQTTKSDKVDYQIADIFEWAPNKEYDFIFFGFWLSHVPANKFTEFWNNIRHCLKKSGYVFFVDNLPTQESTAIDHTTINNSGIIERKLNDGSIFHIVKHFYDISILNEDMANLGWECELMTTGQFFIYGILKKQK